jgi:hypothetical protein
MSPILISWMILVSHISNKQFWKSTVNASNADQIFRISLILEKTWAFNVTVCQLVKVFMKTYDTVRRRVLYNILTEFCIFKKLVMIIIIVAREREMIIPPLWSSGQSSWLQIKRSGFGSGRCQIFWEVAGLERGPLSLASTTEELLGRNSIGSCLEISEYACKDPSRWPRGTLYPQKLALS